jgi:hypothetical protein
MNPIARLVCLKKTPTEIYQAEEGGAGGRHANMSVTSAIHHELAPCLDTHL